MADNLSESQISHTLIFMVLPATHKVARILFYMKNSKWC